MPLLSRVQPANDHGRVLFRDAGFEPVLRGSNIELGPGQLAVVGFGRFSTLEYDLGVQQDVHIPLAIRPIAAEFVSKGKNTIRTTMSSPERGDLRIIVEQHETDGRVARSTGGAPPRGITMGNILMLRAWQGAQRVSVDMNYDKAIWSGLSWAAGEIKHSALIPGQPLTIECSSAEKNSVRLEGRIFAVEY